MRDFEWRIYESQPELLTVGKPLLVIEIGMRWYEMVRLSQWEYLQRRWGFEWRLWIPAKKLLTVGKSLLVIEIGIRWCEKVRLCPYKFLWEQMRFRVTFMNPSLEAADCWKGELLWLTARFTKLNCASNWGRFSQDLVWRQVHICLTNANWIVLVIETYLAKMRKVISKNLKAVRGCLLMGLCVGVWEPLFQSTTAWEGPLPWGPAGLGYADSWLCKFEEPLLNMSICPPAV